MSDVSVLDRPAWIPDHIRENWDPDPYAYQTEEELMPAGGPHGVFMSYVGELLRSHLKPKGLMLLFDVFLLFRNKKGIKDRKSPDLLLTEYRDPALNAYDLDKQPVPEFVGEITSPSSRESDKSDKMKFWTKLGVRTYLLIDALDDDGNIKKKVTMRVWRNGNGARPGRRRIFSSCRNCG